MFEVCRMPRFQECWARAIRLGSRSTVPGYFGGVVVPVSAGGGHPADGCGGLEVEDLGENGGGQSAGEVHESGPAGGHGRDAEAREAVGRVRLGGGDVRRVGRGSASGCGQVIRLRYENGRWLPASTMRPPRGSGRIAWPTPRLRYTPSSVVITWSTRERDDAGELLGVEQDQAAGHPVGEARGGRRGGDDR